MNYTEAKYLLGNFKKSVSARGVLKLLKNGDIYYKEPGKGGVTIKKPKAE